MTETPAGVTTAEWLEELPAELASQATILRRLLAVVQADERFRGLQVQGSIGRGKADRHSDIDVGVVVAEEAWPAIANEVPTVLQGLGNVVDQHSHFLPSAEVAEVLRAWAHMADGVQLDMLVLPQSRLLGSGPDGRTLMDRDGLLLRTDHPRRLSQPSEIVGWAWLCWQSLTETMKYLERDRVLVAMEWLTSARRATLSCWAAAYGLEYAGFANVAAAGIGFSAPLPDGFEKTYPTLDRASVLEAAKALAAIQTEADRLLETNLGVEPRPLAGWVRAALSRRE